MKWPNFLAGTWNSSQDMLTMGLASSKYVVTRYAIDDANKSNEINNIEECLLSNGSFMRHNTCHV
jgi:hypothetical protein